MSHMKRIKLTISSTMAIWALGLGPLAALAGAAPQVFETAKLVVPPGVDDVVVFEFLGKAVSATEEAAWVAEPVDNVGKGNEGSVFGFRRSQGGWELLHNLTAAEPVFAQTFGWGVAFGDRWGVVGSPHDRTLAMQSGAVHFIEYLGGFWKETQKVKPPHIDRNDQVGWRVALSGNRALVSAPGDDDGGFDNGAAYVYRRTASGWILEQKLIPVSGDPLMTLAGDAVDLDGDVAVLGARTGFRRGTAFVFERTAAGWIQTAELQDPTPINNDTFGRAVAVDGDVIAIGEMVKVGQLAFRPGSVLMFERTGPPPGNWVFTQELQASNKSTNKIGGDQFGVAVDLHEGRLLVGADSGKINGKMRGTANLFERGPNGWEEIALLAPSESILSGFGRAVSLSASFALVGAPFAEGSVPGILSGAAYVYEFHLGEPTCDGVPNSTTAPGEIWATGSLAAHAGALDLWAADLPRLQTGMFLISRDAGFVPAPGGSQGNLCLGGNVGRFVSSVQSTGSAGEMHYVVDTDALPFAGQVEILAGETWHFQAWHRDMNPVPTSNFTGGLAIAFR